MTVETTQLEKSIMRALVYHRGQTDKAGLLYVLHPLRVMSSFVLPEDDEARIVAVLHDIVEDTEVTLEMLRLWGYPETVVAAIDAISRRKDESYSEYIFRVAKNPLATRVKLADLNDNLDERRASTGMLDQDTLQKYTMARLYLMGLGAVTP